MSNILLLTLCNRVGTDGKTPILVYLSLKKLRNVYFAIKNINNIFSSQYKNSNVARCSVWESLQRWRSGVIQHNGLCVWVIWWGGSSSPSIGDSTSLDIRSVTAVRLTCFCSQMSFSEHQCSFNIYVNLSNTIYMRIYVIRFSVFCSHPVFIIDDLDKAAVFGFTGWRWDGALWLLGFRSFFLQLLLKKQKQSMTFLTILTTINQQWQRLKNKIRTLLKVLFILIKED